MTVAACARLFPNAAGAARPGGDLKGQLLQPRLGHPLDPQGHLLAAATAHELLEVPPGLDGVAVDGHEAVARLDSGLLGRQPRGEDPHAGLDPGHEARPVHVGAGGALHGDLQIHFPTVPLDSHGELGAGLLPQ